MHAVQHGGLHGHGPVGKGGWEKRGGVGGEMIERWFWGGRMGRNGGKGYEKRRWKDCERWKEWFQGVVKKEDVVKIWEEQVKGGGRGVMGDENVRGHVVMKKTQKSTRRNFHFSSPATARGATQVQTSARQVSHWPLLLFRHQPTA